MPDITDRGQPLTRAQLLAWAREQVREMHLHRDLVLLLLEQAYVMGQRDAYLTETLRWKEEPKPEPPRRRKGDQP